MAKKKTNSYHTVAELLEQQRQKAFSEFSVGDDKEYHTVEEIQEAAYSQGLLKRPEPTVEPPAGYSSGRQAPVRTNPLDLRNQIQRVNNELIPKINQEAERNYQTSRVGSDYLSKYDDSTSYTDVQNDITQLQNVRGGAKRRGNDTSAYDRAIEMLKSYASQNYNLDDTSLSLEDRTAIYNRNKQDIADLSGEGDDEYARDYSLMRWLGMYDKHAISSDEANQTAIDLINKDTVKYDVADDVGGLNDEGKKQKAEELRTYFQDKYGYGFNTDYLIAANDFYKVKKSQYENAKVENTAYDRLGKASAVTNDITKKEDYDQNSVAGDYGTPTTEEDVNSYLEAVKAEETATGNNDSQLFQGWSELGKKIYQPYQYNTKALPDVLGSFFAIENEKTGAMTTTNADIYKDYKGSGFETDLGLNQSAYGQLQYEGYSCHWDEMTDKEIGSYYYLLNTQGKDAAYEYLDGLTTTLQKRANFDNKKTEMEQSGEDGTLTNLDWLVRNASTVPDKVAGGIAGTIDNTAHYITGEDIEPYSNIHGASLSATATREAAGETLDKKTGADKASQWAVKPSDIYQGAMSAADMATALLIGPEAYGASMGMSAAEDTARELWEQGEDNDTINAVSTAAGTAEMLFEEMSLDKIIRISNFAGANTAKDIVKRYLKNMAISSGIEASEEVFTEAANMMVDYAIRGERSDEAGYSFEDVSNRLYKAGLGGAIGGLLGGGMATTSKALSQGTKVRENNREYKTYTKQAGQAVTAAGNAQALIDQANAMDDSAIKSKAAKASEAIEKKGADSRAAIKRTGQLYAAMQDSNTQTVTTAKETEIKAAIKQAYAEATNDKVSSKAVSIATDAIYKANYTDEQLTRSENKIVSTPASQKAYSAVKDSATVQENISKREEQGINNLAKTAALTQPQERSKEAEVDTDEFTWNDDGKTYTLDGEKQVDVKDIASVGQNDIQVRLSNGTTESVKALDLGSADDAVIYQGILDVQNRLGEPVSASLANSIVSEYKQAKAENSDLNAAEFIYGVEDAVRKGYINDSSAYDTDSFGGKLSVSLQNRFYDEGRQLVETHTSAQRKAVSSRLTGTETQRKGSVTFEDGVTISQLDERRSVGVKAQKSFTEAIGVDTVFYQTRRNSSGQLVSDFVTKNNMSDGEQAPSGFWKDGKLYIDVNAGLNGEGLILFTASHEMTHMMEDGAPEIWQAYADFIVANYIKRGVDVRGLVLKEMTRHPKLNYQQAFREVIARASESMLVDTHLNEKSKKLYKQNRTLWEKIRDAFSSLSSRIKKAYRGTLLQSEEARLVRQWDKETLEKAQEMWLEGVTTAANNIRNMEGTTESGTRYALRGYSTQQLKNWSSSKRIVVYENDTQFLGFITKAKTSANDSYNPKMYFGAIDSNLASAIKASTNIDVENYNLSLSASEIKKIFKSHGDQTYEASRGQRAVTDADIIKIPSVVLGATKISTCGYYNGKPMIEFVKQDGNERYTVRAVVSDKRLDLFVQTAFIGVKKRSLATPTGVQAPINTPKANSGTASFNKSVSQTAQKNNPKTQNNPKQSRNDATYMQAVNDGDMLSAKRKVELAANKAFSESKVRDRYGDLRVVYHWTDSDFTEFDTGRSGTNQGKTHGDGIYVSTSKDEFSYAGKNLLTMYADIRNPFEMELREGQARYVLRKYAETKHNLDAYDGLYFNHALSALRSPYKVMDYLKEYADDNGIQVSDILKDLGYDGVHDGSEWVAFSSDQLKSADPVTYDDDGNVIPLSQRFDTTNADIRYESRNNEGEDEDIGFTDNGDFYIDLYDDDNVENLFAREYVTHHEDIGEVLQNISDIDIAPEKVTSIVNRVFRENVEGVDATARELLSMEIQIALEQVNRSDAETVVNDMIDSVRKAVTTARVTDDRAVSNYNDLLSAFKGRKFYLTDEQISQLKEHDMTLNDFRKKMFGYKITIVSRENARRSVDGGYADATEFSLEGLYDMLEAPEEYLPYKREQWDEQGYDAPYILMDTLEKLRNRRSQPIENVYSDETIDDMAVAMTAKITGAIVEEKYKTKYKGKDSTQIKQALSEQQKQTDDYIAVLVDTLTTKHETQLAEQKEKAQKKLAELKQKERDRAAKREQEIRAKYREQRARGYENRKRTEMRGKIRNLADRFQQRLTKPKGKQYVPQELIAQTVDVLNTINLDSGRSTRLSEKIAALRDEYDKLKKDNQGYAVYDDVISDMLSDLRTELGDTAIMDMSLSQLKQTYDVLRSLEHVIRESVKMTDTAFKVTCYDLARMMIAETKAVPKSHSGLLSGYTQSMLSAERMFNRLAGFKKDSTWNSMYRMLNDGQLHMTQLQMEFSKIFGDLLTDAKQLRTLSDTKHMVDIGLVDEDGNKVLITRGMMLSLYMHLQNEDNTRHVMNGGLTVPNMKQYYKGDITKAFGEGMQSVRVGMLDYSQYPEGIKSVIEKQLTEYEIAWIDRAHEFFDVASRDALNDTTMKLYHFKKAVVDNYFPIHTDSNYRAATFENIVRDMSLENSGFMKDRVKASNPILLEDIVDVINTQIQQVSKYCGMTIPIKNFQKVYGTTMAGFETSVQKELNKKFSGSLANQGATKYIDNLLTDLTSGRQTGETPLGKVLGKVRGNLAAATLTLNVRVAIAQAASYPTAAAEIGWKPLMKAFVRGGQNNRMFSRVDNAAIDEITPLLWYRKQGYSNTEIGDIKELRKQKHAIEGKVKKAMGWIEFFDGMTVGRLFYAAQYYVDEQYPSLKRGTQEYKDKVAEVYNNIIERTQPNYTTMQRPDILRNPNALVKSLTMFMTQRLQNFNIVYDAVGTYNKYRSDLNAGINGVTAQDLRQAKTKLRRAIVSQTVAAATIVGMKLFADMLMHSMNGYRDDDDELTAESVSLALLNNFADTIFGSVLFGSEMYSILKSMISGETYYGISLSGVDSLKDALTAITNLRKQGITLDTMNKVATTICQVMGIPLNNAEKIGKALYNWTSDFTSDEGFMESGVNRTNKQNIHRAEMRYTNGDAEGSRELLSAMIEQKKSEGKTDKEAKSWLRSQLTSTYKPRYVQAAKDNNTDERTAIRQFLYASGAYGSLTDLDKALSKWTSDD